MNRAALYIRVSTLEQAQEGYSVGEQKERLIAYCKAKDWIIADIYVDGGYTGSNLNRPGIQKLISETDKFDLVLVYKLDRLSRSQRDTLYLIEEVFRPKGVDFISMQESFDTSTPFGKAMIGLLAVFAQLEREQIKERTWMGRVARAKTGLHHGGGHIPIGYEYEDGHLVINPYEAEQVRKIYEWYLAGDSLKTITDKLQEAGYTNKYSSYNSWTSVRNILGNETYTGRLHFGDVIVDNAHEPIISKEQFDAAQVLRGKRQEQYGGQAFQSKHLLAGLIYCGHCGGRYYLRNTGKYSYYACYSRTKQMKSMVKDPNCMNKIWKGAELEPLWMPGFGSFSAHRRWPQRSPPAAPSPPQSARTQTSKRGSGKSTSKSASSWSCTNTTIYRPSFWASVSTSSTTSAPLWNPPLPRWSRMRPCRSIWWRPSSRMPRRSGTSRTRARNAASCKALCPALCSPTMTSRLSGPSDSNEKSPTAA